MEEGNVASVAEPKGSGKSNKTVLIVVIAVIVIGALAFGYFKFFGKQGGTVSNVLSPSSSSECKQDDPDLCKFLNNWKNPGDMTMSFSTTGGGTANQGVFKLDGDNSEMTSVTAGKEDMHIVSIGETTYTLDYTDNKWWKYTPTASEESDSVVSETKESLDFDADGQTTYKKIGEEACGKFNCFKYQVIESGNTESTEYIYFDDKDYLLRKTRSESSGVISESTVEYGNVSVSAPSPVKEGNPYGATVNTDSGASQAELEAALDQINAQQGAQTDEYPTEE